MIFSNLCRILMPTFSRSGDLVWAQFRISYHSSLSIHPNSPRGHQLSHGSQDLYTTFMQKSKGFSASLATKANIVGEVGAVVGAMAGGFVSQILGRRLTLIFACV